jgi:hypothetical protein
MFKKFILIFCMSFIGHVLACSDNEAGAGEIRIYKSYYTYAGKEFSTKAELREALRNYSKKEIEIYTDPCANKNDSEEIRSYLADTPVELVTIKGTLCACEE